MASGQTATGTQNRRSRMSASNDRNILCRPADASRCLCVCCRSDLDDALVLCVRDSEVLAVDVHEFELEVRVSRLLGRLEHELNLIAVVLGLERDDVVVAAALEDLGHAAQVDAQGNVAVRAVKLEALGAKEKGNERHVRGIHGCRMKEKDSSARVM